MYQLAKESSGDQEITVYEANQLYGKTGRYRFMQFSDHAVQGAIDLKDIHRIVLEYPRAIIHLMEINEPSFEHVFMIGHGVGTIARHYPRKQFSIAEIDEKVLELSRRYFYYDRDNVLIGDGFELLMQEEDQQFDYIILDAFTEKGIPEHLTTWTFFTMTSAKLNPRGSVILNLTGNMKHDPFINAVCTTLKEVYAYARAFALPSGEMTDAANIVVMGSKKRIECDPQAMAGFIEIELDPGHIIYGNSHE